MHKITLYSLTIITFLYLVCSLLAINLVWHLDMQSGSELTGILEFAGQVLFVFLVSVCAYWAWRYYFELKYNYALTLIYMPLGLYVVVTLFSAFFLS